MNNLIAFFEIPTVDFYRAINFYETILGLKLSVFECETEKIKGVKLLYLRQRLKRKIKDTSPF